MLATWQTLGDTNDAKCLWVSRNGVSSEDGRTPVFDLVLLREVFVRQEFLFHEAALLCFVVGLLLGPGSSMMSLLLFVTVPLLGYYLVHHFYQ